MRSRLALPILVLVLVAGCTGAPADGSTATDRATATQTPTATTTSSPSGDVDFPDGPKERPAYNSLWMNEYTDVTLDCRVDDVTRRDWGYEAVVTCTGYSNTRPPENSTNTVGPHADWFTQSFRYRVSEEATERVRVENRDPV